MQQRLTKNVKAEVAEIRRTPGRVLLAYEKRNQITKIVIADFRRTGTLFKASRGHFYFEKQPTPKLYPIEGDSIAFSALIEDRYGINSAEKPEYEHLVKGLHHECHLRGQSVVVHRLAHYDQESSRLYVSRFDGWVYRLNGRAIHKVPNGTDGMFFWDDSDWQPYELFRGKRRGKNKGRLLLKQLVFDSANFTAADSMSVEDQRWLFSVWLRSHFFASLLPTKPLLLVCGEKGSGKTLALRKWLRLLFGQGGEVTALEREKPDGFVAAICSQPVIVFDNVDEQIRWLPDRLCQLATGATFRRREYYTTNEEVKFKPDCFIALNSRTPKFIEDRDDVLDRALILDTERIGPYKGEAELLEVIAKHRNSLWTELLRDLNKLLALTPRADFFRAGTTAFRMADFAGFASAVARAEGQNERVARILSTLERRRAEMLADQEPIALCLEKWLGRSQNPGRTVSSAELQRELGAIAQRDEIPWPYKSAHSLGQRLSHIESSLTEQFRVESTRDSAQQRQYQFRPKAETLNLAESEIGDSAVLSGSD